MTNEYQVFDKIDANHILLNIEKNWKALSLPIVDDGKLDFSIIPVRRSGLHSFITVMVSSENKPVVVVKFPRYKDGVLAFEALETEALNIGHLKTFPELEQYVPEIYFSGTINSVPVIIEKAYEGRMFHEYLNAEEDVDKLRGLMREGSKMILNIHKSTRNGYKNIDAGFFSGHIDLPLKRICQYYPEYIMPVERLVRAVYKERSLRYPVVFQHGDLNPWNIMCLNDGRKVIFDFEDSNRSGLPFADVFNYFVVCFRILFVGETQAARGRSLEERKKRALLVLDEYKDFVKEYCGSLDIDESLIDLFFVVFGINATLMFIDDKRLSVNYGASWFGMLFNPQNISGFEGHIKSVING